MTKKSNFSTDTQTAALFDFISYTVAEKGYSNNTVEAYKRDIEALIAYLKAHSIYDFASVTQDHLIQFLSTLKASNYAASSMARSLAAFKVFFKFMKRESLIKENVAFHLDTPKLWQKIPSILSIDEMKRLLDQPDLNTPEGIRDRAILELLYSSGLRVSELCSLMINCVDDKYVRVFGKGRKERLVPLGKIALDAIDKYLSGPRCLYESENEQHLFLSNKGKVLNRISVWQMVKEYAALAKIEKCISPHSFRHSFATHLLDNGADLRVIQEMLGHASISSTDRYTHISQSHLQDAFKRCHKRY